MLNVTHVSDALNQAFDSLTRDVGDDTYVSVSAAWTNPAGKLLSMHISLGSAEEDDDDVDIDVQRRLAPVPEPEDAR